MAERDPHSMREGTAQDILQKGFGTAAVIPAGCLKPVNVRPRQLELAEQNG